jgi:hypothetical protein
MGSLASQPPGMRRPLASETAPWSTCWGRITTTLLCCVKIGSFQMTYHKWDVLLLIRLRFLTFGQVLGSAYLIGATAEQLQALYDAETSELDTWEGSPMEISCHDWRDYLGDDSYCFCLPPHVWVLSDDRYQRAYLDFFEDELVKMGYHWRDVVVKYMLSGPKPLIHGAIGVCRWLTTSLGNCPNKVQLDNR